MDALLPFLIFLAIMLVCLSVFLGGFFTAEDKGNLHPVLWLFLLIALAAGGMFAYGTITQPNPWIL